jgi:hypothetical protein
LIDCPKETLEMADSEHPPLINDAGVDAAAAVEYEDDAMDDSDARSSVIEEEPAAAAAAAAATTVADVGEVAVGSGDALVVSSVTQPEESDDLAPSAVPVAAAAAADSEAATSIATSGAAAAESRIDDPRDLALPAAVSGAVKDLFTFLCVHATAHDACHIVANVRNL